MLISETEKAKSYLKRFKQSSECVYTESLLGFHAAKFALDLGSDALALAPADLAQHARADRVARRSNHVVDGEEQAGRRTEILARHLSRRAALMCHAGRRLVSIVLLDLEALWCDAMLGHILLASK